MRLTMNNMINEVLVLQEPVIEEMNDSIESNVNQKDPKNTNDITHLQDSKNTKLKNAVTTYFNAVKFRITDESLVNYLNYIHAIFLNEYE